MQSKLEAGGGSGEIGGDSGESDKYNGHAYVDLGLPLGLKWATCNVGANKPEGYGNYYAWGETEPKSDYSWNTYKWCNDSPYSQTKYCASSGYGIIDNKTTLDPEDDVAHVKWGGDWRMPTKAEQNELRTKCTMLIGSATFADVVRVCALFARSPQNLR